MRIIAAALVLSAVLIFIGVVLGDGLWLLGAFALVPIALAVGITVVVRMRPLSAALYGGVLGFGIVVLYASIMYLAGGPEDRASDPDCDGFCTTYWGGWMLLWIIAAIVAAPIGLVSAVLAAIFASGSGPTLKQPPANPQA